MTLCQDSSCGKPATVKIAMAGSQNPQPYAMCDDHARDFAAFATGSEYLCPVLCPIDAKHPFGEIE